MIIDDIFDWLLARSESFHIDTSCDGPYIIKHIVAEGRRRNIYVESSPIIRDFDVGQYYEGEIVSDKFSIAINRIIVNGKIWNIFDSNYVVYFEFDSTRQ